MKNPVLATLLLSACLATTVSAQVKAVVAANKQPGNEPATNTKNSANASRARVIGSGPKAALPSEVLLGNVPSSVPSNVPSNVRTDETPSISARSDFNHLEARRFRSTGVPADKAAETATAKRDGSTAGHTALKPAGLANAAAAPANPTSSSAPGVAAAPSQTYRVGVRDVLDIQLSANSSRASTLFTVLDGGLLEYPLAGNPLPVSGLTTTEIAALLRQRIRVFDNPSLVVSVRDYASHTVSISGLVGAPGTKVMRREAMPLYTMLAEALVLPEAAQATITRQGRTPLIIDLKDATLQSTLVLPGDAIKVSAGAPAPTQFFFVGGEISSPGQKPYHDGLTLTQAILASGGTSPGAGSKVKVSRQGSDGKLNTDEYNLKKIQSGKAADPMLQAGDRIEITNAN